MSDQPTEPEAPLAPARRYRGQLKVTKARPPTTDTPADPPPVKPADPAGS